MQTVRLIELETFEYVLKALQGLNKPIPKRMPQIDWSRDVWLFDIPLGPTAFAGRADFNKCEDSRHEGLFVGTCPDPNSLWELIIVPDFSWQDLYCEAIEPIGEKAGTIEIGDDSVYPVFELPLDAYETDNSGKVSAWLFCVDYVHDVHDHSNMLASVRIRCRLDLNTGKISAIGHFIDSPHRLPTYEMFQKMQPGDYVPIGKDLSRLLMSHINTSGITLHY